MRILDFFVQMLTPDQARKIDPSLSDLKDCELEPVLAALYDLGRMAVDAWGMDRAGSSKNPLGVQFPATK